MRDPGRDGPGSQTRAVRGRTRLVCSGHIIRTYFGLCGSSQSMLLKSESDTTYDLRIAARRIPPSRCFPSIRLRWTVGIGFVVARRGFPHVIGKFLQGGAQPSLVVPFFLFFAFARFEIFVISGMNASTIWSIILLTDIESDPYRAVEPSPRLGREACWSRRLASQRHTGRQLVNCRLVHPAKGWASPGPRSSWRRAWDAVAALPNRVRPSRR
jgi:hypothetical protein